MLPPCFPIFPLAERNPEFATPATPCSILFPLSATAPYKRYLQSRSSFIARPDAGWLCLCMCMGVCVSHFQVFPSAVRKAARWYLGDCRLRGRAPGSTRAPTVSEERVMGVGGEAVMTCRPASRHAGAPSEPKGSDQIRSCNGCDEKQQVQSDASCAQRHNGGLDICAVTLEMIWNEPTKRRSRHSREFQPYGDQQRFV